MVVVTEELADSNPQAVTELYRLLEEGKKAAGIPPSGIDTTPFGKEINRSCLQLLNSYAAQQGLISRRIEFDDLW
jgi:4,5-dihydroxyphthalate decarboxylase